MVAMAWALTLLPGCFSLERNIGEKRLYSLEATTIPELTSTYSPLPTLLVKEFDIAPMYTSNSFLYRRGEFQFETDYYNEFIISPQRMITAAVKQALFDTRRFSAPLARKSADHRLQGCVIRLYGDFRQENRPLAVMEISLTLDAMEKKSFSKKMPIKNQTPGALIAGWNTLLEEIIREFISGLDT
jgi:hypothetical protein